MTSTVVAEEYDGDLVGVPLPQLIRAQTWQKNCRHMDRGKGCKRWHCFININSEDNTESRMRRGKITHLLILIKSTATGYVEVL